MTEERFPRWAQERLQAEEGMGKMQSSAGCLETVVILGWYGFLIFLFALFCGIVYLVGKGVFG